jgi:hypothetical protein
MLSKLIRRLIVPAIILLMTACVHGAPSPSALPIGAPTASASATPSAGSVLTTSPSSTLESVTLTSTVSSLSQAGHGVGQLAMDDNNLYWTADGRGDIFRYPLHASGNAPIDIFARTQFDQGKVYLSPSDNPIRSGQWLVFADNQIRERRWALRAINTADGTERRIAEGAFPRVLLSFSSDGTWVAWATEDEQIIQDPQTGLTVYNFISEQKTQLGHPASMQNAWYETRVASGRLAANRQTPGGSELDLFDLASGLSRPIALDPTGTMHGLAFDGHWMAWIPGAADTGPTMLYDLQTGLSEIVPHSDENNSGTSPLLAGHWLTWNFSPNQPLLLYDLNTGQYLTVAEPQPGDELTSPAIHGNEIIWCRLRAYHPTPPATEWSYNSTIEWRALPG